MTAGADTDQREYLARCAGWRSQGPLVPVNHPEFGALHAVLDHRLVFRIARADRLFRHGPRSILQAPADPPPASAPRSLIDSDGAEHRALRALVAGPFQPAAVRGLREPIRKLARQSVERALQADGPVEAVDQLAMPYALASLMTALGLPAAEAGVHWLTTEPFSRQTAAKLRHLDQLLSLLAASPSGAPLASLLTGGDGRGVDRPQQALLLLSLLTAGYETTAAAVASGLRSLIDQPQVLARLADAASPDAELLGRVTEEILRTASPITGLVRTVAAEVEVAGLRLAAGQRLWLCFAAANSDGEVFADPSRFDADRAPGRHISFGAGSHHCLGAGLARLQLEELVGALAEAGVRLQAAGQSRFYQHSFLRRYTRLPVLPYLG
jgi:cytochrome P450